MAAISQSIYSDAFSRIKSFAFWLKFHWSIFLPIDNRPAFGLDIGLGTNKRAAIIWMGAHPIRWRIYVALGEMS